MAQSSNTSNENSNCHIPDLVQGFPYAQNVSLILFSPNKGFKYN